MVLFFFGKNTFALQQKVNELIERFKAKSKSDFGLERFDASEAEVTPAAITSAMTSLPMFGDSRLVIINEVLSNKDIAEAVLDAAKDVPPSNVVIAVAKTADERTKIFKDYKAQLKSQEFNPLNPSQLETWLKKAVAEAGGKIEPATRRYLIERVGNDQWRLHNEILKLVNFDPHITTDAIDGLVEPTLTDTIFDLLEAISHNGLGRAFSIYEGLRANKAQPLYVLSMLGWQLKNLLVAKSALSSEESPSSAQIAKDFKMSPFVVNKSLSAVRNIDFKNLKAAHSLIITCDYKLKTTQVNPDILIEQLLHDIARVLN